MSQLQWYPGAERADKAIQALLGIESTTVERLDNPVDLCLQQGTVRVTGFPSIGINAKTTLQDLEADSALPHLIRFSAINNIEIGSDDQIVVHFRCLPTTVPQKLRDSRLILKNPKLSDSNSIPFELKKIIQTKKTFNFAKTNLEFGSTPAQTVIDATANMPTIVIVGNTEGNKLLAVSLKVPAPKEKGDKHYALKVFDNRDQVDTGGTLPKARTMAKVMEKKETSQRARVSSSSSQLNRAKPGPTTYRNRGPIRF